MKRRILSIMFVVTAAVACNNESSVQDDADSTIHVNDANQSNWPEARDMLGKDSIPSPATQSDSPAVK